jgi:serine/threonine protein phosphatase PrpC
VKIAAAAAETNVGRKRRHNEDNYVAVPEQGVFAVADGMGGAQAGEVASALAAGAITETVLDPSASGEERVVGLIKAANLRVHQRAAADSSASGMGTTMTVAMLQADGTVAIGHVGDSRAYRLRDGRLDQLTDDHSLVAELVRRGELSPAEAAVHPQRSVITRALGTEADVDVDAFSVETQDGDVFLLCSDGLTTMVDPDTIADILRRSRGELDLATHALIKAANDRGGDDNITAVLFMVGEGDTDTQVLLPPAREHHYDDEDTLHPEDGVRLPDSVLSPPPQDFGDTVVAPPPRELGDTVVAPALRDTTMIVSAEDLAKALGERSAAVTEAEGRSPFGPPPTNSTWPSLGAEDAAGTGLDGPRETAEPHERASAARILFALLVILALAGIIVWLVLDALPR